MTEVSWQFNRWLTDGPVKSSEPKCNQIRIQQVANLVTNLWNQNFFSATVNAPWGNKNPRRGMLDHILQEYKVTHILALAAQAGVRYATKDPASYVASNVAGDDGWGWGGWAGGPPLI